jgi:hypothetical protein
MTTEYACDIAALLPPQKNHVPEANKDIGTWKGFSGLSVGAFLVGRRKVPHASSLPAAAAPRPA